MIWLLLGLALWTGLYLFRSAAPSARAALQDRLGDASKGLIALGLVLSVVLMVIGYRGAAFIPVWTPPAFFGHINNLLMLFAFYVYFITATKPGTAWVMDKTKNPQLTGFKIWAVAHLLANGDLASLVLFGGLLAWAVAQVILSKRVPSLVNRETGKISSPFVHAGLALGVYALVAGVHIWLGVNPFGTL
jgi:uncharacterized membrane protein